MPGTGVAALATASELRPRLAILALVLFLGTGALLIRDMIENGGRVSLGPLVLVVIPGAVAGVLFRRAAPSLRRLRTLELVVFAAASAYLAMEDYSWLLEAVAAGNVGRAVSRWNTAVSHFALLAVMYGVFIPCTWQRAVMVVVPIAAVPLALGWLMRVRHPEVAEVLGAVGTLEGMAGVMFLLLGIAAVAILGASVIAHHRSKDLNAAVLGMYNLIEKIGSGGMGEVWLARHHVLARPAAIKLIRGELLGDGAEAKHRALRRFEREAQTTAALRSPHTIEVYDFGVSRTGVFFYVMEYLQGLDLATLVKRFGPVPGERAVHYLIQACDSLGDAHSNNLIHRDIKPANIHACRMGTQYDYVKVLDFGLVKSVSDQTTSTEVTLEGTTTGTPAYMAPETATGAQTADPRSDLYALGCVAYFLLTGRPPFEADGPVALLLEHINTIPTPPSKRTEVPIPEELDRVVLKCLEKDPANRFQSAKELAAALSACSFPEPWSAARAEDWWAKHLPRRQEAAA